MKREEQERLEEALLLGLRSGKGVAYGTKEWRAFKKNVLQSLAKKEK